MDIEKAFLSKLIETKDMAIVLQQKIRVTTFSHPLNRSLFAWLLAQYTKTQTVPSNGIVSTQFADWRAIKTSDDLSSLTVRLKEKKAYSDVQTLFRDVGKLAAEDAFAAIELLKKKVSNVVVDNSEGEHVDVTKNADRIREAYKTRQKSKGVVGLSYPVPVLDLATHGAQAGHLIGFYGRPGTFKTYWLLYLAMHWHAQHGEVPIVFTGEMTIEEMEWRLAGLRAKVNLALLEKGALPPDQYARFEKALDELQNDPPFIITDIESFGDAAITEIIAKTREARAGVVFIDGVHFLQDDDEWKSLSKIVRGLKKEVARGLKIPVIVANHANRSEDKKEDASNVSGGDALYKWADVLYEVERTKQNRSNRDVFMRAKKVRNGTPISFSMHTDFSRPETLFMQKEILEERADEDDVDAEKEGDIT